MSCYSIYIKHLNPSGMYTASLSIVPVDQERVSDLISRRKVPVTACPKASRLDDICNS